MSWGQSKPACLGKKQGHLSRVLPGPQDGGWGQNGLRESFTGHPVSSKPEARSAGAQETAHGVVTGVLTDSLLLWSPALIYICGRALLPYPAMEPFLLPFLNSKDWESPSRVQDVTQNASNGAGI